MNLINLSNIAKKTKKFHEAVKYLRDALHLCKSGEIREEIILRIQEYLGLLLLKLNQPDQAVQHFQTAIRFLEGMPEVIPRAKLKQGKLRVKLARAFAVGEDYTQSKLEFKRAMIHAKSEITNPAEHAEFLVAFYSDQAVIEEKRKNISKALIALRRATNLDDKIEDKRLVIPVYINLGRILVEHRNSGSTALKILAKVEDYLNEKQFDNIPLLIKIYSLKSAAYDLLKDIENSRLFSKRSADLRRALVIRTNNPETSS